MIKDYKFKWENFSGKIARYEGVCAGPVFLRNDKPFGKKLQNLDENFACLQCR